MKGGYFSRLARQTGIAFGDAHNSVASAIERPLTKPEERDTALSIHVEERQIVPRQDREVKIIDNTGHTREDPESSDQIANWNVEAGGNVEAGDPEGSDHIPKSENTRYPGEEIKHPVEERFENKPSSQKQEPAERKHMISGREPSSETVIPRREVNREELPESRGTIKINSDGKEPQQPVKPPTSPHQEHRRDTASGSKSTDQIFQVKTRQVYLKEVRDWVAGTSHLDDGKIKSGDTIETGDMEEMVMVPRNERAPQNERAPRSRVPAASYPEQQRGKEGPGIHDFHLSIGTISLTVEEPQKGTQSKEPPRTIKAESREQKETSRLSRHYIRV